MLIEGEKKHEKTDQIRKLDGKWQYINMIINQNLELKNNSNKLTPSEKSLRRFKKKSFLLYEREGTNN